MAKYSLTTEPPYQCNHPACEYSAKTTGALAMHYNRSHTSRIKAPGQPGHQSGKGWAADMEQQKAGDELK